MDTGKEVPRVEGVLIRAQDINYLRKADIVQKRGNFSAFYLSEMPN